MLTLLIRNFREPIKSQDWCGVLQFCHSTFIGTGAAVRSLWYDNDNKLRIMKRLANYPCSNLEFISRLNRSTNSDAFRYLVISVSRRVDNN